MDRKDPEGKKVSGALEDQEGHEISQRSLNARTLTVTASFHFKNSPPRTDQRLLSDSKLPMQTVTVL
jgi:hypothetical protein